MRFQSTLPRGERLGLALRTLPAFQISIHAPARGATINAVVISSLLRFQSTLPRGERRELRVGEIGGCDFNPRSREGSDNIFCYNSVVVISISIHAPARGATSCACFARRLHVDFNPRSREGSDVPAAGFSTKTKHFNPRSREGSD